MFKSSRKKAEKTKQKLDFKLEFQASRVPPRGWDKLMVSLIPLETGKASAKSSKASVRNGSCQWTESLYESVKISQDIKEKDKGLYKIVVSTGSNRFGILGEITINLAEHTGANVPTSLALPLQNCNAGTVLHVRIQCLTPKVATRDMEDRREASPEQDAQSGGSEENPDFDSDLSGTRNSDARQLPEHEKQSSFPSLTKDGSIAPSLPRYSIDSVDIPSTPEGSEVNAIGRGFSAADVLSPSSSGSSFTGRQEFVAVSESNKLNRTGSSQEANSTISSSSIHGKPPKSGGSNIFTSSLKITNDPTAKHMEQSSSAVTLKWNSQGNTSVGIPSFPLESNFTRPQATSHRRSSSLSTDLDAAETSIEEIRRQAVIWERNARKLGAEVENLKQQLATETKRGTDMGIEISALLGERDIIMLEVEQLKSTKQVSEERDTGQEKLQWEVESARNTIRELQDELEYEKTVNANQNVQLQKTQESNSELLLEIQDLEEALQNKNNQIEELKLEHGLIEEIKLKKSMEDAEVTWMKKIQVSEVEIQNLQERIVKLQASKEVTTSHEDLKKTVDILRHELDELERDSQELTEENMDLLLQLKKANDQLSEKNELIDQLESKVKLLLEQSSQVCTSSGKICDTVMPAEVEADNLKTLVHELKEKLRLSEEFSQSQLASSRLLLDDMSSSALVLRSRNAQLESQLTCSEEKVSSLVKQVDTKCLEIEGYEKETYFLKDMQYRLANTEEEYANVSKRAEDLEAVNKRLKETTDQAIATLELQLKNTEQKVSRSDEQHADAMKVVTDLEKKNSTLREQISLILVEKEAAEFTVTDLERLNEKLQDQLQQAESKLAEALNKVNAQEAETIKLVEQLAASGAQLKDMEDRLHMQQKISGELDKRHQDMQEENRLSKSHIKELEFQLSALQEDMHYLNESRSISETKALDLDLQNDQLKDKLKIFEEDIKVIRECASTSLEEIRALNDEIESHVKIRTSVESILSDLECKNELLQSQMQNLPEEKFELKKNANLSRPQHTGQLEEKEATRVPFEDVQIGTKKLEFSLQKEIQKLRDKLKQVLNEKSEVFKEAEGHKVVIQDLEMCIENMNREIVSNKLAHANVQDQLEKVKVDSTAAALKIALLNSDLVRLQQEGKETERRFSGEIQTLYITKDDFKERAEKAEEMLRRNRLEKESVVERLQEEIQLLNAQISSKFDDKERLTTQALSEASRLRAERGESEEKLRNMQETVTQAETNALFFREKFELKVKESETKEQELEERLQKELKDMKILEMEYCKKIAELEQKCLALEEENRKLAKAKEDTIHKKQNLQEDLGNCKNDVQDIESDKLSLRNSRLAEEFATSRASADFEQRNELIRLREQMSEFRRMLVEQEKEREEFRKRVFSLEEELERKTGALAAAEKRLKEKEEATKSANGPVSLIARSLSRANSKVGPVSNISPSRDNKELSDIREKVKLLEDEVKMKALELEASKQQFKEKETEFHNRIEHLELVNEQLIQEHSNSNIDQLQRELKRLQIQNEALFQRENELLCKLGSQEILQNELEGLEEEKRQLETILSRFNEVAKGSNILKRVATLETELAEALEANNMYKSQLQSAFAKQQNVHTAALENLGSVDQVIKDLADLKRKNLYLEGELKDMRDRYSRMSLQFAEVEAEREELVMTVRSLRNGRKLAPFRSKTF